MVWGVMPPRAAYALVLNAVMVILLMTLMGYARSSSRVHWHVYGVMQDTSPYAYSPALGYAAAFMALNTFMFCMLVAFIFWVASLGGEKKGGTTDTAHMKAKAAASRASVALARGDDRPSIGVVEHD
jgi:hypothetical protein